MIRRWLMDVAARIYVAALARDLTQAEEGEEGVVPISREEVRRLAWREINAIRTSIEEHALYQDREQRILSDRLSRRYDLGMALNEAANRAIGEKKATMNPQGLNYPTPQQQMALKLQEETLKERIRNS